MRSGSNKAPSITFLKFVVFVAKKLCPRSLTRAPDAVIPERLWWALLALVPLAVNPLSRWEYEPDKAALTLALVAALLGLSLARGSLPLSRASRLELRLLALLGWRWVATARSILPAWSLFGEPGWRNGLWLSLAGAVLFLLARRQLHTPERRQRAVVALIAGSALIAAYGILQAAGLDPFSDAEWLRVPSTLAHANLLAAYLALVMPLTLAQLLQSPAQLRRNPTRTLLFAGALALQTLCLIFTYSRTGWLAAAAGLGILLLLHFWTAGRRTAAALLLGAGLLAGVTLLVLSQLPPLPNTAPHALQTLTSLLRWQGATGQIRLLGWQAGLAALRESPWLGYGPGTFSTVLPWHLPAELAPFGGAGALGGRPHNVILEVALESGLPGGLGFIALLAALLAGPIRRLLKTRQPSAETTLLAALVGALVANLISYAFSFESVSSAVLFWTLAGMAHPLPPAPNQRPQPRQPVLGALILAGGAALALWMLVPDMLATAGERLTQRSDYAAAVAWLDPAIALAPTPEVFTGIEANVYLQWGLEQRDDALLQRADALHARRTQDAPQTVLYWQQWGDFLRRWYYVEMRPELALRAVEAFSRALELSPNDPDLWLDRGLAQLEAGQSAAALADFERAQALLPDYTRTFGSMAIYALRQGDTAAAAEWQARAAEAQHTWDEWVWRR